jgi:hypothetical protein
MRVNKLVESRFIGTVLAKPKARLCEPWETKPVLISGAREAGDISVSIQSFNFRVRINATAQLKIGRRLAAPTNPVCW